MKKNYVRVKSKLLAACMTEGWFKQLNSINDREKSFYDK